MRVACATIPGRSVSAALRAQRCASISSLPSGHTAVSRGKNVKDRSHTTSTKAVKAALAVNLPGLTQSNAFPNVIGDPFDLIKNDLRQLSGGLKDLITTDHPVLKTVAQYLFESPGKRVRPSMVLLMAHATSLENGSTEEVNEKQRRLAEITEMIHTASLLHDDVLDLADTRRGRPTAHVNFGNKVAVLAGDFLLARSSLALARLRNVDVIEMLSTVIEHLVKGEIMQMKDNWESMASMDHYMKKTFYKTGSLVANSCKASAILGDSSEETAHIAYEYGRHVGLAFQLVDDALDLKGDASKLGKASQSDLAQGVVTAPLLFCLKEHSELEPLMRRKFSEVGDVQRAYKLMEMSGALQETERLAQYHGSMAIEEISKLKPSAGQDALVALVHEVLNREK